ncbi:ABC transporter substrate-binding protein [Pueribacillus sp. YX66]|uniref:ABC transporter substrate-binding protein n=1 Tax=Pueribacillus sp. YX66 TaxID=3229242 RepID=UPI00358CE593
MNLKKWLVYSFILSLFILAACGGDKEEATTGGGDSSNGESEDSLRIGVVTTLSGPYGEIGNEMLDAVKTAVKEVNEQGGVLGKQIELVVEDDEVAPDVAIRKAEKMVLEENINLFIGSVASSVTLALSEKMPDWESLLVTTIPKSVAITDPDSNSNVFRVNHNDNQDVLTLEHWMKNADLPYKTFYFLGADYEWGHDVINEMETIVEDIGGEILGEEFTPLGATDYSTVLTNARSKKPDAIIAAYAGGDGTNFLSQVNSFGIVDEDIDVIITPMGDSLATTNPELTKGIYGPANYHHSLDNKKNVSFVKSFEEDHGYKPTNFSGESYVGAWMLFEAIEEAGSANPDDVIKVLEDNFTFDSAMGELRVDPRTHQVLHPNWIGEFFDDSGEADIRIIHTTPPEFINPQ